MKQIAVKGSCGQIPVSSLIFGTGKLGGKIPELQAYKLLDRYWTEGGFTLDTARIYGHQKGKPADCTEALLGRWMKDRGNRSDITLISKGGHPPLEDMTQSRLSKTCIGQDIEDSLTALNTDYVDIYFLHRDDPEVPVGEIMDILDEEVQSRRILALGASNWCVSRIMAANQYALAHGKTPFSASEINWSLARTTPEIWGDSTIVAMNQTEYEGYCTMQMPVFAFTPLAKGYFSKGLSGTLSTSPAALRFDSPENRQRLKRLAVLCEKYQLPPSALALAYLTSAPVPTAAIIGCSTVEQVSECMSYSALDLSEGERLFLTGDSV